MLLIFFVIYFAFPPAALADIREFTPRLYYTSADFELNAGAYIRKGETEVGTFSSKEIYSTEKLRFYAMGFSYHPNFLLYQLNLGIGLRHEKFSSTFQDRPLQGGHSLDYDLRLYFLLNHPYNLQLFTRHSEPLPRLGGSSQSSATDVSGGIFNWKGRSGGAFYLVTARVIHSKMEYLGQTTLSTAYGADGSYSKDFGPGRSVGVNVDIQRDEGGSFFNADNVSTGYQLGNRINYDNFGLGSSVSYNTSTQSSSSSEAIGWSEILSVRLPWNFNAALAQALNKSTQKSGGREATNTSKSWLFNLNHRLYESLTSGYAMTYNTSDSSFNGPDSKTSGTSKSLSSSLTFSYSKKIPYGYLLSGVGLSKGTSENSGKTVVVNEAHTSIAVNSFANPGVFDLNSFNVDKGTIEVRVRSSLNELQLVRDVNYTVATIGNTIEISVFYLPDPPFPVPGVYDFYVSYSLLSQGNKTEFSNFNYNLKFGLFNDMVAPFYSLSIQKIKVISGSLESTDSTSHSFGLILSKPPYRAMGQYSVNISDNPSTAWRIEIMYSKPLQPTFNLNASAQYSHISYGKTKDGNDAGGISSQNAAGANLYVSKRFPSRAIYLNFGGGYSRSWNLLTISQSYSLNSQVNWFLGKFTLKLGAEFSYLISTSRGVMNKESTQYYYLSVQRKLY